MSATAKQRSAEPNPYPVTRAYMEATDFYARMNEIAWRRDAQRRRFLEAQRYFGKELDAEEDALLATDPAPAPGRPAGPRGHDKGSGRAQTLISGYCPFTRVIS